MLISYPDLKVPLLLNHDEKFLSRKTPHLQESRRSHSSAETYHSLFLSRKNIEAKPLLTLKGRDSPQTYRLHTAFHASFAARLLPCGGRNVSPTRFSSPFESLHIPKEKGHFRVLFLLAQREGFSADLSATYGVPRLFRRASAPLWR